MKREIVRNGLTELVFILDRSGSMHGLEADTIGGFNSMLEKQKRGEGGAFVTTYLFDGTVQLLHDRAPLEDVHPMTEREYYVGGCTALIDAMGEAIEHIASIHKYARGEDVPEHTVFVVITDGMENASRRYSSGDVRHMVEKHKERDGWEFLFLGANIDAVETAARFSIAPDRAVNYRSDSEGTRLNYEVLGEAICQMRGSGSLKKDWAAPIRADYEGRKKDK